MSFQDIKGQDKAIERIKKNIDKGHIAGAYLFCGPEGVGKSLAAITLAKALNCQEESDDSCDNCVSCRKIGINQHPDVHLIGADAGSESLEIKIEAIRELQSQINLKPYEGRKKVFIIRDAHNLTPDASNAFLKTLEEPPGESLIILTSSKPALIFKTIVSRCQAVKFSYIRRDELRCLLKEKYQLDEGTVHFLAYFSEGSLGYAVRLKDRDILNEKNRIIDGFIKPFGGIATEGAAKQKRETVRDNLHILASWFRDIYLVKSGLSYSEVINLDRKEELSELVERYSFVQLDRILKNISNSLSYLDKNVNVKLILSNLRLAIGN